MRVGFIKIVVPLAALLVLGTGAALADTYDLSGYDYVISDTGEIYDGWEECDTRVWAKVLDGRHYREHYFDSLPAAFFVLREKYGTVRIAELGVPVYAGEHHEYHGHLGHGLIDAASAWYIWDYDHYSRGGLPLVLAFYSYDDARYELRHRNGDIMSFSEVIGRLGRWCDDGRNRIYWRGWHPNHWTAPRWNNAWHNRWDGWEWKRDRGWFNINFEIGGVDVSIGSGNAPRHRPRHNYYDRYDWHDHNYQRREHAVVDDGVKYRDYDRDRGRGRDYERDYNDDRGRGRDRDERYRRDYGGNDRDDDDRDRERSRENERRRQEAERQQQEAEQRRRQEEQQKEQEYRRQQQEERQREQERERQRNSNRGNGNGGEKYERGKGRQRNR